MIFATLAVVITASLSGLGVAPASAASSMTLHANVAHEDGATGSGQLPMPSDDVTAVSCVTSNFCVAVGYYFHFRFNFVGPFDPSSPSPLESMLLMWNGSTWSLDTSPSLSVLESSNPASNLDGVSCVSTTYCVAVGSYDAPDGTNVSIENLILTWNGRTWTLDDAGSLSTPPTALDRLTSVSCVSTTFCVAAGWYQPRTSTGLAYPPRHNLFLTWNGMTWTLDDASSLSTSPTQDNLIKSVSCVSTTFCVAAGYYRPGTNTGDPLMRQSLVLTWNGMTWTLDDASSLSTSSLQGNHISGVSCASTSFCVAVGTAILAWDGATWSLLRSASSLPSPDAVLTSVSCTSASFCMVAGTSLNPTPLQATDAVVIWNGSTWSFDEVPSPSLWRIPELMGISCVGTTFCAAAGTSSSLSPMGYMLTWNGSSWSLDTSCATIVSRYWFASPDGGVFAFGLPTGPIGSMAGKPLNAPIVAIATSPTSPRYWLVASDGGVFSFGLQFYGSMGGRHLNAPIIDIASTPDAAGYWEVASDGGIFAFGDAGFYGSMGGRHLNAPIVGFASTPDGKGYWEVASDGGIFAFGDASFYGSMGGRHLNAPIVGIAADTQTGGYWEVASDGGIFAYHAPFYGSMGGRHLNAPIVAMAPDSWTGGYWQVASDGGVFAYHAPFYGSMGGRHLNAPIVSMAASA